MQDARDDIMEMEIQDSRIFADGWRLLQRIGTILNDIIPLTRLGFVKNEQCHRITHKINEAINEK